MATRIIFTVTNDLNFDQRMIRICTSLSKVGYDILLVGRHRKTSTPCIPQPFQQKRLPCFFDKGKWFYLEYNLRLFVFLLFQRTTVYCAIDLDTILPVLFASVIRRKQRVYDAHELFCEMEEVVSRPAIHRMWRGIEKFAVPRFSYGYTIGACYAEEFYTNYGVRYDIVRNATVLQLDHQPSEPDDYILYQGAVNEGRSFETLIPAMKQVNSRLIICGEGNYFEQAKALCTQCALDHKITFTGYVKPDHLKLFTQKAKIGITLFTHQGKSNFLSMANRFFDYMHAGVPQLCVDFPEYQRANEVAEVAVLINRTDEDTIAEALNDLLQDAAHWQKLRANCLTLRQVYCWQEEEKKLVHFYKNKLHV